ncbi:kin of IRRE-like protein 2 isoform X2 [Macrobrachium rosenbergii]|uniref:kin of IRRE-like protein 2 isoform X2 n=1 Tax=Macrobrachium rosenbergii TaxID=79674 RepID=UPI0034D55D4A
MIGWREITSSVPANTWVGKRFSVFGCFLLIVSLQPSYARISPNWPQSSVQGVEGMITHLPCMVARSHLGDTPNLVLWYKDGARLPFYTLDLREGVEKQEFVDPKLKDRIRTEYTGSHLVLDRALGSDSGRYRCRVDFNNSPTLSAIVTLTIYVVPTRLVILGEDKKQVRGGVLRSLTEGDPLTLYCIATGGRPPPQVSWWKGDQLLSNRSIVVGEDGTRLASEEEGDELFVGMGMEVGIRHVRTMLSIPALSRDYARANISCKAANNNITEPLSTTLYLEVYTQPSSVVISGDGTPLVEGQSARLECVASGAFPTAILSWEKSALDQKTQHLKGTPHNLGEVSTSTLIFGPEASDHGATLTCHAHNPNLPSMGVSTSTTLQVSFVPRVTLRLGYTLASQPVTEGDDVYFECEVVSNPPPHTIKWFKDGSEVHHDLRAGVLVSSNNLVLQMVRRTSVGNYSCSATNKLATVESNSIALHIRYLPVCSDPPQTVTVVEGEDVRLTCRVDANPKDGLRFTWYFNNTLDTVEVERHRVQVKSGYSYLDYTPRSSRDYGVLACWATNTIGTQADPCQFTVVEAGPPESVTDCDLVNHTGGSLEVLCTPGEDGGLPQWFEGRVYSSPSYKLLVMLEESTPRFHVGGLTPGSDYIITITSRNRKGTSHPVEIDAVKLKVAEKRMSDVSSPPVSPLVGVFLGLVGGFILLLGLGITLTVLKLQRCLRQEQAENQAVVIQAEGSPPTNVKTAATTTTSSAKTPTSVPSSTLECLGVREEVGPDVVKSASGEWDVCAISSRTRVVLPQ